MTKLPLSRTVAAGLLLAGLAGCSHAPLSASDCGRHFTGGSGLLGLAAAVGAFDRDAGPDCQLQGYAMTSSSSYIPPDETWRPEDPAPLPLPDAAQLAPHHVPAETPPSLFVSGGGGTLVGIGGSGPMPLMVPAGGGTFMSMP